MDNNYVNGVVMLPRTTAQSTVWGYRLCQIDRKDFKTLPICWDSRDTLKHWAMLKVTGERIISSSDKTVKWHKVQPVVIRYLAHPERFIGTISSETNAKIMKLIGLSDNMPSCKDFSEKITKISRTIDKLIEDETGYEFIDIRDQEPRGSNSETDLQKRVM